MPTPSKQADQRVRLGSQATPAKPPKVSRSLSVFPPPPFPLFPPDSPRLSLLLSLSRPLTHAISLRLHPPLSFELACSLLVSRPAADLAAT